MLYIYYIFIWYLFLYSIISLINYKLTYVILFFLIFVKIILSLYSSIKKNNNRTKNKLSIQLNINLFLSTFFITFASFIVRLFIIDNYAIDIASDYIFCFSVGSLLSTLYVNSVGVNLLVNRKLYPLYLKFLISLYFISILLCTFIINFVDSNLISIWLPTAIGSLVLFKAQEIRLSFFIDPLFQNKILIFTNKIFFTYLAKNLYFKPYKHYYIVNFIKQQITSF